MKQKIAIIAGYGDSLINFRGHLIQDLIASGYEVHAIAPEPSAKAKARLINWGVHFNALKLARTSFNPFRDLATLYTLIKILSRIQPDIVLSYTIKPVIYGSIAAKIVGIHKIYAMITGLGYAFVAKGWRGRYLSKFVALLYRWGLSKTSGVMFQNPDDLAEFHARKILSNNQRTTLIHGSGVDIEHFSIQPLPGEVSFLLIARLLKAKGIVEYVEAARRIRNTHPNCQFHIVGWLDESPNSISQADLDTWINEGTICYLGKLDDVRIAIANTAVYVLPSYSEGTPRTVLEAMAMGRPVITTDAPGCRETVIDGHNGYLVRVGSVDDLVDAMRQYVNNPNKIEVMGHASACLAREKYDVKKVNKAIMNFMNIQKAE